MADFLEGVGHLLFGVVWLKPHAMAINPQPVQFRDY